MGAKPRYGWSIHPVCPTPLVCREGRAYREQRSQLAEGRGLERRSGRLQPHQGVDSGRTDGDPSLYDEYQLSAMDDFASNTLVRASSTARPPSRVSCSTTTRCQRHGYDPRCCQHRPCWCKQRRMLRLANRFLYRGSAALPPPPPQESADDAWLRGDMALAFWCCLPR